MQSEQDAREIAEKLTKQDRTLLLRCPDDAQMYDYSGRTLATLGLVDEYWTWVSSVRPGIQRNHLGRSVASHLQRKSPS